MPSRPTSHHGDESWSGSRKAAALRLRIRMLLHVLDRAERPLVQRRIAGHVAVRRVEPRATIGIGEQPASGMVEDTSAGAVTRTHVVRLVHVNTRAHHGAEL